jgi:predicted nucleic-acid-binding Zn-ribbon protein
MNSPGQNEYIISTGEYSLNCSRVSTGNGILHRKEARTMVMKSCPKCGSENIDHGRLLSAGGVGYKSDLQKVMFVKDNCTAYACMDCGYVESYVNTDYFTKLKNK